MVYSELTVFINQILDQKGLTGVDLKVREQLVSDLEARLMDQINRAIVNAVPEEKMDEFERLASDAKDEDIQKFLVDNGVDTQKIASAVMILFKDAYLGAN